MKAGTQLGPYEILSPIGAGGMGEVYRARDMRLDRIVAIKVLPDHSAANNELRQRFEREARAVSSLNHPHICTLHDIGHQDELDYLVMELIEGESLADRLIKGPLPADQVLRYAIQIADALDKAHHAGIVHRDLKPANIMLTKSGTKLLDFGLAKMEAGGSGLLTSATSLPTERHSLTGEGTILGTFQYMAPEQLEGREADARTDIFAFGAVVYEMATGKKAFTGKSQASLIGAILHTEPPAISTIQPMTPPALDRVVKRCLAKDPEDRWQTTRDLTMELTWISESGSQAGVAPVAAHRKSRERVAWIVAAVLLLATLVGAWAYFIRQPITNDTPAMKFSINPPEKASFDNIAISPDGRWLAFTAATGGKLQLWVRALDAPEARALAGTEGARFPFWSPDNLWIGFFTAHKLKKIEASGGRAQTLCDAIAPTGGTWNRDGVILFSTVSLLRRVSAVSGEETSLTVLDRERQEIGHLNPCFLPDGRHFLYSIQSGRKEMRGIYVGSLDGNVKQRLLGDYSSALYAPPGFLLFGREGALMAQPFDADRRQLSEEAFPVAEQIENDPVRINRLNVSVSDHGVLVMAPHVNRRSAQFLWLDRGGKQFGSVSGWSAYSGPTLAPDEKRFVADRRDSNGTYDLWLADLSGAHATRFTFDPGSDLFPVWSPDGSRIVWSSLREGQGNLRLYQKAASGAGQEEPFLNVSGYPADWSHDGRFLIYIESNPQKRDVWVLPLDGVQQPFPLLQTDALEGGAALSPDGRWLAYVSDESRQFEVYVQRFPSGGGKRQITTNGGMGPQWRRDGTELFYYSTDGKLMAMPVRSGESFEPGTAMALFEFRSASISATAAPYTVTRDGQRFLVNAIVDAAPNAPLMVVVNWTAGSKK